MSNFADLLSGRNHCLAMPVLTFPGSSLCGVTTRQMVTDSEAQVAAVAFCSVRTVTALGLASYSAMHPAQ